VTEAPWVGILHDQIEALFTDAGAIVDKCNRSAWWAVGERRPDPALLDMWVAFNRQGRKEEDVVLFFSLRRKSADAVLAIDLTTGEGEFLADGPVMRIPWVEFEQGWHRCVIDYASDLRVFMAEVVPILRSQIC
jgi:hypothetical protein